MVATARTIQATRAKNLLDNFPEEFIPYNFCREDATFLCEAFNPASAQAEVSAVVAKGSQAGHALRIGLSNDLRSHRAQLNTLTASYPGFQRAVDHDIELVTQKAHALGSILQKIKKPVSEETPQEVGVESLLCGMSEQMELVSLHTLKTMKFPGSTGTRILHVLLGVLGLACVFAINTVLFKQLEPHFGQGVAFAIGAVTIAPFVEELYKVIIARYVKSPLPTFVVFVGELIWYMWKIFGIAGSFGNPIQMVIFVLAGFVMRVLGLEMHMTTAAYYARDVVQSGRVHVKTFFSGMLVHGLWNFVAIMGGLLAQSGNLLGMLIGAHIPFALPFGIGWVINKVMGSHPVKPESEIPKGRKVRVKDYALAVA